MTFQYIRFESTGVTNIGVVQDRLSTNGKGVTIDTVYLAVIESAENGNILAIAELAEAFRDGRKGVPRHYELAKHYADLMIKDAQDDVDLLVETHHNSGFLECSFGNYQSAIRHYNTAIDLMHKSLPVEEWEPSIYKNIWDAVVQLQREIKQKK